MLSDLRCFVKLPAVGVSGAPSSEEAPTELAILLLGWILKGLGMAALQEAATEQSREKVQSGP